MAFSYASNIVIKKDYCIITNTITILLCYCVIVYHALACTKLGCRKLSPTDSGSQRAGDLQSRLGQSPVDFVGGQGG